MESLIIATNILFSLTCVPVSYFFMKHYPKEINNLFGYRTKRSMASQQAWLLANRYSSRLMFNYAIACTALQFIASVVFDLQVALFIATGFWVLALLSVIFFTERMLRETENNQDKQI